MSLASSPSPRAAEPTTAAYSGIGRQPENSSRKRRHNSFRQPANKQAISAAM